jgi:hypothetical protein
MSPLFWLALIEKIAIPELQRWLSQLNAEGRTVTEAEIMAKLELDANDIIAIGQHALDATGGA